MKKAIFVCTALLLMVLSLLIPFTEELTYINVTIAIIGFACGAFSAWIATEVD